ncbi:MAG: aldehyde dehydrogenase [Naasia sp.]|nr:aldehyde dehydrogenase [Naasia sp.]
MPALDFVPHLIDGQERSSRGNDTLDNVNPWTQAVQGTIAAGGAPDAADAIAAARAAFEGGAWSRLPERQRGALMHALADRMEAHAEELAQADSYDMGRPLAAARSIDVPRSVAMIRFFGDHVALATSEMYPMGAEFHAFTAYRPAGVVVAISPWNHPLMLGIWKIAAALAWGNTVVWKPAEDSPTSAYLIARYALEAGWPGGVLNVVQGAGAVVGEALISSPDVDRITFTGSTAVGRHVGEAAARNLVAATLELGGKGASMIFDDADLDLAASTAARAVFNNTGQVCLAGTRVLVQRGVHDAFMERFAEHAAALRVGDPLDPQTDLGPLASKKQFDRVSDYFALASAEGGTVVTGGPGEGWSFTPTIVTDVSPTGRVWREEVFGPMATVTGFDTFDEGVALANDTDYGLTATLFSESAARIHTAASRLRTGTVWANCYQVRDLRAPIGGPGFSGIGREGGNFSREFFTEPQAVFIKTSL